MKLMDMKIGTQLRLGIGIILLLVVALGGLAWVQADQFWLRTKRLYEHPYTICQAVYAIETHVLAMHRDMLHLCLTESERERDTLLQDLDGHEAAAHGKFAILYDRYLGPRSDIEEAEKYFLQWKTIRDETRRLLREGKTSEAVSRTRPTGVGGSHAENILAEIKHLSDSAENRAGQFYRDAEAQERFLGRQLVAVVAAIFLLSMVVAWLLLKGIKTPLTELTAATHRFQQGKLGARSRHVSENEFGALSAAFNTMADTIQTKMQKKCMRSAASCSKAC
jgi:HAMP domain-containing protein